MSLYRVKLGEKTVEGAKKTGKAIKNAVTP